MIEVKEYLFSDIMEGFFDGPHATPAPSDEGPVFLGIKNIKPNGGIDLSEIRHISENEYPKWTKRVVPTKDDIVFSYEATLHRYALIPDDFRGCLGRRMALIRVKKDLVDPLFLYYHFLSPYWKAFVETVKVAGSTVDRISIIDFPKYKISLPELPTQKKIASILSAYDDLIENNNQRIQLLEEMAEEIYKEWFVRLRFPGYHDTKFFDKEGNEVPHGTIGALPEQWEKIKLNERYEVSLGGTPSRGKEEYWNGEIPWINSGKVNDLRVIEASEKITDLGLSKSATKLLPKKTTLLAITGATLGQVSFLEIDSCTNQSIVGIKDPKSLEDEFIFLSMKEKIKDLMNYAGGGAQQHINKNIVDEAEITLPNVEILKSFSSLVKPQFDLLSSLLFKNKALEETRNLLLPRLISGKLSVERIELSEQINL